MPRPIFLTCWMAVDLELDNGARSLDDSVGPGAQGTRVRVGWESLRHAMLRSSCQHGLHDRKSHP